jgi:D-serine deaminase-like pyridoxal phosphate-dependent protein
LHEIRPGVFVFFDEMQIQIGSSDATEIAMAMICPVVSVHPQRQEATVYGGAVHLSKDFIVKDNEPFFGRVMHYKDNSWDTSAPIGFLKAVSQEHGTILLNNPEVKLKVGDLVAVLPVHACLAANLMKSFYLADIGDCI